MDEMCPTIAFDNIAMAVTDLERSIEWYGRFFGFEPVVRTFIENIQTDFVIMRRGDVQIEFLSKPDTQRGTEMVSGPHLATSGLKAAVFRTDDLEGVTKFLERQKATFAWKLETISVDGLRATMVRDPDGALINILSYPEAQ